jgi:hypothetical protein
MSDIFPSLKSLLCSPTESFVDRPTDLILLFSFRFPHFGNFMPISAYHIAIRTLLLLMLLTVLLLLLVLVLLLLPPLTVIAA